MFIDNAKQFLPCGNAWHRKKETEKQQSRLGRNCRERKRTQGEKNKA